MSFATAPEATEFRGTSRVERLTDAIARTGGGMNMVSEVVNVLYWPCRMNGRRASSDTWCVMCEADRPQYKVSDEQ